MPSAFFLNGTPSQLLLVLNSAVQDGAPPAVPRTLAPYNPVKPGREEVTQFDIVAAAKPGGSQFGARNRLQVSNPSGDIDYTVTIEVDTNTAPLTTDFLFIVFADGVLGRHDTQFNGITITRAPS